MKKLLLIALVLIYGCAIQEMPLGANGATPSGTIGGLDPVESQSLHLVAGSQPESGTIGGLDPVENEAVRLVASSEQPVSGVIGGVDPVFVSGSAGGFDPKPQAFKFGDESTVPFITDRGREDYRTWLQWYSPKAFAISENGAWYGAHGNLSSDATVPADPSQRALQFCEKRAKMPCKLYAVNASIVWGAEVAATAK